ncbi:ABC transporter permease [Paenibacillus thermoaerophilus]|nr:ABC transporter permease [Paenibacillus thermoaerophilus]
MFNLIANENMKIYRRFRTWILIGLLVLASLTGTFLSWKYGPDENSDWRQAVQENIKQQQEQAAHYQNDDSVTGKLLRERAENEVLISQYRLDHDIPPPAGSMWENVLDMSSLIVLITIFTVIIAGDSVASEFTWGTIKLLLIRPANRTKILASKFIATLLFSLLLLVLLFVVSALFGGILFGFDDIGTPHLKVVNGAVKEVPMVLHAIGQYGLNCVSLIMYVSMAFMISSVFRSSSLGIGLSVFLLFAGQLLVGLLVGFDFNWAKYLFFANTDLTQYLNGMPLIEGMTMGFSIAVLTVYFAGFLLLSWLAFTKRDIAA